MKYRILGKTGLRVSEIGFGCWELGGDAWKSDDKQSMEALRTSFKFGVNFFDTAFDYGSGHSEMILGEFAREVERDQPDKRIVIATKVPPKDRHWPAIDDNAQNAFPKDHIVEYAMKSYKNLGSRTIDILQLHVWRDQWTYEKCWQEAFDELKKTGIVKFVGVSINDNSPESALKVAASGKIDSLQTIYNIFDQSPEDSLFEICMKNKVGVIARVPFDEGSLTGRFTEKTEFSDWRKDYYFQKDRLKEVVDRVDKLRWLEKPRRTMSQAALQFCLHHAAVSTVIPGSTNSKHVEENARASDGRLTEEEIRRLKDHRWARSFYHKW
jgi:aryl-alcohol dehydrogenase-like predicted oxidoreductase